MDSYSYLSNATPEYIENLYNDFKNKPESVETEFRKFFEGFDFAQLNYNGKGKGSLSADELKVYRLIEAYRRKGLPPGPARVAIEAGVRQGWDRWLLGERGREAKAGFVGMSSFGASAPIDRLNKEFGITAENAVAVAKSLI